MKVIVAMSGGVDSSVAAYVLKKRGFDVIGLSFELWDRRDIKTSNACCSIETIQIAKSVAKKLGLEHYTVDVRDDFYKYVIEDFCTSYIQGITPNPCILCNKYIKFDFLLKKAEEIGADLIGTGHYARITNSLEFGVRRSELKNKNKSPVNRKLLLKGIDAKKDQSYVLYVMKPMELAKTVFPIGSMKKEETREIARELGLAAALRAESQEICFIGDDTYVDFIKNFAPDALQPGPIVNMNEQVVGEHKGIAFYTIGQRKGLGIASLKPHYVANIDQKEKTIVVGSKEDVMKKSFKVRELNWISIDYPSSPMRCHVKIRSTMQERPATVRPEDKNKIIVDYDEPQWAPAPGQSAVFYDGEAVLGGGIIEAGFF